MRTGSCAVQQGLTAEAASIVKQAVTLAKRRGHAQVTPLHVANTMLSVTNGLLRRACLQSHSHPLQCKALELCFNVALNRLPASSSSSAMLGTHSHHSQCPSISNALVAAFKRAQAHQRRGSIENQQQPLLAVKIELEQLVISILDDPSVSRVMKEAGFSSPQVKSNVEQAVSLEICSQNNNNNNPSSVSSKPKENNNLTLSHHESQPAGHEAGEGAPKTLVSEPIREEDVSSVIDNLVKQRRRSTVIVGESLTCLEGVVKRVMDKVDKGDVGESVRGVKFVSLSLSAFSRVSRLEVEHKIEELRILAQTSSNSRGYVLYLGDLKGLFEYWGRSSQHGGAYYCPVDHMVMEIGRLVTGVGECGKFWLMSIATFRDYMRCKNGNPSLETVWGLHPIIIPAGTLRLSLVTDSGSQNQSTSKKNDNNGTKCLLLEGGEDDQKQPACLAKFERQGNTCNSDSHGSSLPTWLQLYKNESKGAASNDQNCVQVGDLCKKWNSMCSSIHEQPYPSERALTFSSVSPSSSTSGFSYEHQHHHNLHQTNHERSVIEPKQSSLRDHPYMWISESGKKPNEPTLRIYIPESKDTNQTFFSRSNPSSNPNSTSSSDATEAEYVSKFKELDSENLKTLCNALEEKVPWQKDIIQETVSTLLQCRSGMLRRKGKLRSSEAKQETWLFFQGVDIEAKEKIARELARLVFGCESNLVSIALSSFSSSRADSTEECRNKRSRDEPSCSYIHRFADAVSSNPHRVFVVEDIDQADYFSQLGFRRAIERGRIADSNGEEVRLSDAIIVLSCESFSSRSRACSPSAKQKTSEGSQEEKDDAGNSEETSPRVSLDLNICIDDEDQLVDDIGLLESVDRRIVFKNQEL